MWIRRERQSTANRCERQAEGGGGGGTSTGGPIAACLTPRLRRRSPGLGSVTGSNARGALLPPLCAAARRRSRSSGGEDRSRRARRSWNCPISTLRFCRARVGRDSVHHAFALVPAHGCPPVPTRTTIAVLYEHSRVLIRRPVAAAIAAIGSCDGSGVMVPLGWPCLKYPVITRCCARAAQLSRPAHGS